MCVLTDLFTVEFDDDWFVLQLLIVFCDGRRKIDFNGTFKFLPPKAEISIVLSGRPAYILTFLIMLFKCVNSVFLKVEFFVVILVGESCDI